MRGVYSGYLILFVLVLFLIVFMLNSVCHVNGELKLYILYLDFPF